MKNIIVGIATILLSSSAFAEQSLNCSNADGTLKRVEQEVWGTNLVSWLKNGNNLERAKEEWNDAKKVVLDHQESKEREQVISVDEIFASEVSLRFLIGGDAVSRITDFVICKSHNAKRLD